MDMFIYLYIVPAESLASNSAPSSVSRGGNLPKQYGASGSQLPYCSEIIIIITCPFEMK